ncbi:MAG: leucine-rich repeat domain-containing protein [Lachnospiraceae bacterium]|nr:leucine-rich repeat domain-containing protein [Lachnospiraceae bacterium]
MPKLKSIGRAAFWQNKKLKLNLTSTIKDIDTYAFAGTQYTSKVKVKVEDGNQTIFVKDGILIKKDGENQIVLLQVGKKL